ncbi:MAG: hypothetical protein ABEJ30_02290 [Halorientalis sp.]
MVRDKLESAADALARASDAAGGDAADRLSDLSNQLETLSTRDRAPDHGRLARIQNALGDLREGADADVAEAIDDADDAIDAFRETIEGV